ncbi:MAG: radical SAM protein [Acidobacteria bacterium]|nr:radical SAM protein [Acidobacteriota bacterium]
MAAVRTEMDLESQVKSLMAQAAGDAEGRGAGGQLPRHLREYVDGQRDRSALDPINIRQLIVPGAGNRRIFRILLTNACQYSCDYCPMRAQRSLPRHALEPEKLARLFMTAFRKGWCDGLFVTSGIPRSPVWAMDRILELVEILRVKMGYRGYLHVKALAGAEPGQVERLVRLVDRVSYNLESACADTLATHAPEKTLEAGLAALRTVKKAVEAAEAAERGNASRAGSSGTSTSRSTQSGTSMGRARKPSPARPGTASSATMPARSVLRAGATTQFVVGLGKETDRDLLTFTDRLLKEKLIHHPQFSAFRPIRETPMAGRAETPALREHRLYQADHLVRDYGFKTEELPFGADGSLPLDTDPKLQWALIHPELFPVELRTASREELRRVPGFGPVSVERFLAARSRVSGIDLPTLKKLGVVVSRAAGFITWCGRTLGNRFRQAALFDSVNAFPQKTYEFSPGTFR